MKTPHAPGNGFTIIELMITLAVAAILLVIAIPAFQNVIHSSALSTGANTFAASLNLARARAIMSRRKVTVCPSTNVPSCVDDPNVECACAYDDGWIGGWIMFQDDDGDGTRDAPGELLIQARGDMDSRISPTTASAFSEYIQFSPTGIARGNNENGNRQFNLCSDGYDDYSRLVHISKAGRVTTISEENLCV